jgi:hypothetical protein
MAHPDRMSMRLPGARVTARRLNPGQWEVRGPTGFQATICRDRSGCWRLVGASGVYTSVKQAVRAAWLQHDVEADEFSEATR